jgi:hypothetical protein
MKLFSYFLLLIIVSTFYTCKDKNYDVFGDVCNYRTDTINVVISPYAEFQKSQSNSLLQMKSHTSGLDTAVYAFAPNSCATLARGDKQLQESDLRFSYMEIRSKSDTVIAKNKTEILALFKPIRKGLQRIEVY